MTELEVKNITIYVYYGTAKLNEIKFTNYCEKNKITVKYNHYSGLEIYFIGLKKDGTLISSPITNSTMEQYVMREIKQNAKQAQTPCNKVTAPLEMWHEPTTFFMAKALIRTIQRRCVTLFVH